MGIIAKLLGKAPQEETARVGGMEDFMTLIRVYYQAVMAMQWESAIWPYYRTCASLNKRCMSPQ